MDQLTDKPNKSENSISDGGYAGEKLLLALQRLSEHHDLPYSEDRALRGLPLENNTLSLGLFTRAADNLGLISEQVIGKPSDVPALVFPFVLLFKNGHVGIATEKDGEKDTINVEILGKKQKQWLKASDLDRHCLHQVIYLSPTQETVHGAETVTRDSNDSHWLWSVVKKFWPTWIYVGLAAFVINLLGLALPLFVMNVYDRVIPYNSIPTLWALASGVSIALLFDFALRVMRSALIDNTGRRIDMNVSSRLFEQALDVKMGSRGTQTGEFASHIREFESVRDFFTSSGLVAVIDLFFIGIFLGLLWWIVGPLALVALIAVPVVLAVTLLLQFPLARNVRNAQTAANHRHAILVESLVGIEAVKSISAEGIMQRRWEKGVAASVRASSATHFWSSFAMYFTLFAQQAVSVILIVWGVFLIAEGEITIGALIASNILAGRVLAPLGSISMTLIRAQQSFGALKFLDKLMELERDHPPNVHAKANIQKGNLELRDVNFSYPEQSHTALDGISLRISAGERVGILGRVGSGKSSLGKLLCGLYDASDGAIVVDDTDIKHHAMADLRQAIGYVGQETELFTGTLRDNILMANPEGADFLSDCCSISGVMSIAQSHPLGFEMPVGERGKSISGGQRQAVGIARAMMRKHKILFLDEPTSQMDRLSETAFVRGFKGWLKPETTLLVATHKTSLLELVDRLIVLENGKIIADGPKDKVLEILSKRNLIAPQPAGKNK